MSQRPPEPPREAAVAFELTRVGRRRRRVDPGLVVLGLVLALVLAPIVHPWQGSGPSVAVAPRPSPAAAAPVEPSIAPDPAAPPAQSADSLALALDRLGSDAAPWGIGVGAAVGPPLQPRLEIPALGVATDSAWWAWTVVHPSPAEASPSRTAGAIETLPASKLCSGVPELPTGAQVLVVTTPSGTPDLVELAAWHEVGWHDEPRDIEPLTGLVSAIVRRAGDVRYLLLANGHVWPDGRYELQVDGPGGPSLSVCLGRP